MTRTVTRLFDSRAQAEAAVRQLEDIGIPHADLSIIAAHGSGLAEEKSFDRDGGVGDSEALEGAGEGAMVGGGLGLLAGLALVAIPGVGPVAAAGWLTAALAGGATGAAVGGVTGGLLGALKDAGVSDDDAQVYAEGVRRGGALVSARVDDSEVLRVEQILDGASGTDALTRGRLYREEGWTGFQPNPTPSNSDTTRGGII